VIIISQYDEVICNYKCKVRQTSYFAFIINLHLLADFAASSAKLILFFSEIFVS